MKTIVHVDEKAYVLEVDEAQLVVRRAGDLITCEIVQVLPNQAAVGKVRAESNRGNKEGQQHGS